MIFAHSTSSMFPVPQTASGFYKTRTPRQFNFPSFRTMMIFLSYVKMLFFYVKSNILSKWSNILRKFYVTMFTPEHSLLRRFTPPLLPPGPPPEGPIPGKGGGASPAVAPPPQTGPRCVTNHDWA